MLGLDPDMRHRLGDYRWRSGAVIHNDRLKLAVISGAYVSIFGECLGWSFWHGFIVALVIGIAIIMIIPEVK